jgi:hypothetical protein
VNFVVLALCVAAEKWLAEEGPTGKGPHPFFRNGQKGVRPLFWALAVAIKIVPAVLLPFFALRRAWTWLAVAALFVVVWCALPAAAVGSRIDDLYRQYWRVFLASSFAPRVQPLDFSLAGTIAWATRTSLTATLRISAAAMVLGWIMQADARRWRAERTRPFVLYLLAIPLASPQSEVHHLAFALPAAVLAMSEWWWSIATTRMFRSALVVAVACCLAATALPNAAGPLFCAALLALATALTRMSEAPASVVSG